MGAQDIAVSAEGDILVVTLSDTEERRATDERTMQQSLEIVRRRIDEAGTREPTIQRQGADRILIQVPGIGSASELKELIGTTALLTFHPVVRRGLPMARRRPEWAICYCRPSMRTRRILHSSKGPLW